MLHASVPVCLSPSGLLISEQGEGHQPGPDVGPSLTTEVQTTLAQCSGLRFGKILNVYQVSIPEVLRHLSTQSTGSLTKTECVH